MSMKITIEITVNSKQGIAAFADEVFALLPTREQIKEFRQNTVPAILPVKFRLVDRQTQSAFIEFDHTS
jgi:hypothetical protein